MAETIQLTPEQKCICNQARQEYLDAVKTANRELSRMKKRRADRKRELEMQIDRLYAEQWDTIRLYAPFDDTKFEGDYNMETGIVTIEPVKKSANEEQIFKLTDEQYTELATKYDAMEAAIEAANVVIRPMIDELNEKLDAKQKELDAIFESYRTEIEKPAHERKAELAKTVDAAEAEYESLVLKIAPEIDIEKHRVVLNRFDKTLTIRQPHGPDCGCSACSMLGSLIGGIVKAVTGGG